MKRRICPTCGVEFYVSTAQKYCDGCREEANRRRMREYIRRQRAAGKTEVSPIMKMRDVRPSRAAEIEREMRKKGLRYADKQKAETLKLYGKVEL